MTSASAPASPARGEQPAAVPPAAGAEAPAAAEAETLTRLYLETLGLVPFALSPAAPPPELKGRLMALLAVPDAGAAPASSVNAAAVPVDAAPVPPAAVTSLPPLPMPIRRAGRWRHVPLALAASLILALLLTCAWLLRGLDRSEARLAGLARQRNAAQWRAAELEAQLARLTTHVRSMRDSLSVMTSPAALVCTLRSAAPDLAVAHGVLFVAADHQHWTLSLRGLRPPAEGRVYQLWFVGDQGTVSAGTFGPGAPTELASEHMPAGTRAVMVTLEASPGSPAPSGPEVLRNSDSLHAL